MKLRLSRLWPLIFCGACAAAQPTPRATPAGNAAADEPATSRKPAGTSEGAPRSLLGAAPSGLAAEARECADYQWRARDCEHHEDGLAALATALEETGTARDRALACLESSFAPGLVLALRAELLPRGCADLLLAEARIPRGTESEVEATLVALGTGARLFRSVRAAPVLRPPFAKQEFLAHFADVLRPWVLAQASAVEQLSKIGPRLPNYAKGIVAIEAGLADLRFVALSRAIELPREMRDDPEVKEAYAVALEQALEPRVRRGRDAALVGLREFARVGVLEDARLAEARAALSELYAGRRLDALDRLLLPAWPPLPASTSARLRCAAKLPTFYVERFLPDASAGDPELLRTVLERGLPDRFAAARDPATERLVARGLLALSQTYFWSAPAQRASELGIANADAKANAKADAQAELVRAVASVLAHGPRDAVEMMLGAPTLPRSLSETEALDALARRPSEVAALAEFDAAYLRSLAPPANDAKFWKEQALRFRNVATKLTDLASRQRALELAAGATDTARALQTVRNTP